MATETIGTARVDVIVNVADAKARVEALQRSVAGFGPAAEAQYSKASSSSKKYADSLLRQIEMQNLTRLEQLAVNAQMKIGGELGDKISARALSQQASMAAAGAGVTKAFSGSNKSVREMQFAMRGLPAQFTDIFTSLASGQRPMMVLLQQGGQLKDMFGGIRPMLGAVGGALLKLVNPYTVVAAAAAALTLAWKQGSDESVAYNKALILTGNFAGVTADRLTDMADRIGKSGAGTEHAAAAALASVVASGKFTADQIELVGAAALSMSKLTGQAVGVTIQQFEKLRNEPTKAVLELDSTLHFLTQTTYDHIRALELQGRTEDASALAMREASAAMADRAAAVVENLGWMEGGWNSVKSAAKGAWDAMLDVGRPMTIEDKLQDSLADQKVLIDAIGRLDGRVGSEGMVEKLRAQLKLRRDEYVRFSKEASRDVITAAAEGAKAQVVAANAATDAVLDGYRSAEERRAAGYIKNIAAADRAVELARATNDAKAIEAAQTRRKLLTAAIEADKLKNAKKPKKPERDETVAIIERIRKQIALNDAELAGQAKLTASERLHVQVKLELEKASGKVTSARRAEIDALIGELDASGKMVEAQQAELRMTEDLLRLKNQLSQAEANQRRANEAELVGIGRGREASDQLRRQLEFHRKYEDELQKLRDRGVAADSAAYRAQEAVLRADLDRSLAMERDFQATRTALMGDWRNGARAAMEDFVTDASDVAGQSYTLFSNAFGGVEDAIVQMATTGKLSMKDMLSSMAADLARFFARRAVMQFLTMLMPTGAGAGTGTTGAVGNWVGPRANGGAFDGGTEFFANGGAFTNSIVNQATPFTFANGGKFGVMGEDGPEAIMPLKRGPDGKLGVRAQGGQSIGDVNVNVTVDNSGSQSDTTANSDAGRQLGNMIGAKVRETMATEMRQGGLLWGMANGR